MDEPYFEFKDITLEDVKIVDYIEHNKHNKLDRLQAIYNHVFIFDLLYKFAKEHVSGDNEQENKNNLSKYFLVICYFDSNITRKLHI